jgi:hypothetical protein
MLKKRKLEFTQGVKYCYLLTPVSKYISPPSGYSFIKVGVTTNLMKRLSVYESHAIHSSRFCALSLLGYGLESKLKKMLESYILKSRSTEWFLTPNDIVNKILENLENKWIIDETKINEIMKSHNSRGKYINITDKVNDKNEVKETFREIPDTESNIFEISFPPKEAFLMAVQNGGFMISAEKLAKWLAQMPKNAVFRYLHFFQNGKDYQFFERNEAVKIAISNGDLKSEIKNMSVKEKTLRAIACCRSIVPNSL